MSIHEAFINKIISHKNWEVIREELCSEYEQDSWMEQIHDNNHGGRIYIGGGTSSEEASKKMDTHMELCWYINNGPGYCERAPEYIKKYLRRLGVK